MSDHRRARSPSLAPYVAASAVPAPWAQPRNAVSLGPDYHTSDIATGYYLIGCFLRQETIATVRTSNGKALSYLEVAVAQPHGGLEIQRIILAGATPPALRPFSPYVFPVQLYVADNRIAALLCPRAPVRLITAMPNLP